MLPPQTVLSAKEADELASVLTRRTRAEVRFDPGSKALYASDLSMYRQVPIGVVVPRSIEDVVHTVAVCHERKIPILARGCGTSLAGQCCNVAVVIDFSKYLNNIVEINPHKRYAWVEPGLINDHLRNATEKYHLTLAPDPATHEYCTLGGMIGNNSCGAHTVMGGKTVENTEELEILTYDGLRMHVGPTSESDLSAVIKKGGRKGEIYAKLKSIRDRYAAHIRERYPDIPRRVSGYNLDELLPERGFNVAKALVGTESTCVLVLRAKMRLLPSPPHRAWIVIGYPNVFVAGDHAAPIRRLVNPIALEGFQKHLIENEIRKGNSPEGVHLLPQGDTWLLVEFGGDTQDEAARKARSAIRKIRDADHDQLGIHLLDRPADYQQVIKIRESGVGASRVPGEEDSRPSWEDAAVPPEKVGDYLRDFYRLLDKHGYVCTLFGHFGDGCIHTRISFNPKTAEGVKNFRAFMTEAAHTVVRHGGSLSGEHGDGQARAELLPIMFGPEIIQAFREFKSAWDPEWRMNPGKVVDPYPLDSNLREGPDYRPKPVLTVFQFPGDHGSLAQATERCFGVGKCRGMNGGTMCPSFHATREEMHSTRGRTRMLFEMLRGEVIQDGWRDEHIKDALDLCLACKGCKGDCPVNVDVATYKAEFLHHYYEGRLRPASAHAMGQIFQWANLASRAPDIANLVAQTPGLSNLAKAMAGVTQRRKLPSFANPTFKTWFERRAAETSRGTDTRPVVTLWADTFNNHFFPHTAQAAVEVLESAGYRVQVPLRPLCCGRPLFDYGLLDQAKHQLREILEVLRPQIIAGTPMVVLEPSCASVFRDELTNLFPSDEDAQRLRHQTLTFGEFLNRINYAPPTLKRTALLHAHCHQKALFGTANEQAIFSRMGLEAELLDSGCCGLAGSFGYEENHYDISMKIGERVLLPRVRSAGRDTLVITDGFSCREQILHATPRHALHLAEVLQMARHQAPSPRKKHYVETGWMQETPSYPTLTAAVGAGLLVTGGLLLLSKGEKKTRFMPAQ
ncbi:MAG TPA: FAD-linked oxidase C-terminal domain-containing protein [Bryobacteraceae bacterium]|nr:FAD-linked oxidase C-terminal domain-containing protein [Bryobacteraceae bacterium]